MFGQDDTQQQGAQGWQPPAEQGQPVAAPFDAPVADASQPVAALPSFPSAGDPVAAPLQNDWQQPAPATNSDWATPEAVVEAVEAPVAAPYSEPSGSSDLMDINQKALTELSPLVSHLDQSPEEKFKTTMMMIQASDNQELIADAYVSAQAITDNKAKAQALLDIVNEINYFTQNQS
jgi:hypothetical protein